MIPRRSTRKKASISYGKWLEPVDPYPEGPPKNAFEQDIETLNAECFPLQRYNHIDDILVYCLFATKRRHKSYRALKPIPSGEAVDITRLDAMAVEQVVHQHVDRSTPSMEGCHKAAAVLCEVYKNIFANADIAIVRQ